MTVIVPPEPPDDRPIPSPPTAYAYKTVDEEIVMEPPVILPSPPFAYA